MFVTCSVVPDVLFLCRCVEQVPLYALVVVAQVDGEVDGRLGHTHVLPDVHQVDLWVERVNV